MRCLRLPLKPISVLLSFIILSVGIIGVSYAYFNAPNNISSKISLGDIDVVFSGLYIDPGSAADTACVTEAAIVDSGKYIEINIINAYPGYTSTIFYEVTNNGSVPVAYELKQPYADSGSPVKLDTSENVQYIRRNGGKSQGQIIVTVGDDDDLSGSYGLYTELNFQQTFVEIK